jgi:uncharacterized membrane protein
MSAYFFTALFGLIGFIIASVIRHKKKVGQALVCPLGSDCNSVVYSSYSKFFGIDIATLGICYYGFITSLYTFFALFPSIDIPDYWYVIGFLLSVLAVIFSIFLIIVQGLVIKEWCVWCVLSAVTSTALLIASATSLGANLYPFLLEYKTVIVILHALAAALGVGTVLVTDIFFMKFLRDYRISHSESEILDTLSQIVWFALAMLILTGIALFLPASAGYLAKTKFVAKVFVVGIITVNGILLNLFVAPKLVKISFGEEPIDHPGELHHLRRVAYAFGGISITSWLITFILGSIRSLPFSSLQIIIGYVILILGVVIISQYVDYRTIHRKK